MNQPEAGPSDQSQSRVTMLTSSRARTTLLVMVSAIVAWLSFAWDTGCDPITSIEAAYLLNETGETGAHAPKGLLPSSVASVLESIVGQLRLATSNRAFLVWKYVDAPPVRDEMLAQRRMVSVLSATLLPWLVVTIMNSLGANRARMRLDRLCQFALLAAIFWLNPLSWQASRLALPVMLDLTVLCTLIAGIIWSSRIAGVKLAKRRMIATCLLAVSIGMLWLMSDPAYHMILIGTFSSLALAVLVSLQLAPSLSLSPPIELASARAVPANQPTSGTRSFVLANSVLLLASLMAIAWSMQWMFREYNMMERVQALFLAGAFGLVCALTQATRWLGRRLAAWPSKHSIRSDGIRAVRTLLAVCFLALTWRYVLNQAVVPLEYARQPLRAWARVANRQPTNLAPQRDLLDPRFAYYLQQARTEPKSITR